MDIRECIEVLTKQRDDSRKWLSTHLDGTEDWRTGRMCNALDIATQTLQDVADGKLIKPMGRDEIVEAISSHHSGNRAEAEKIADALQGRV